MNKDLEKKKIEIEVEALFKKILKINENIKTNQVTRSQYNNWDSINHLNLILSIEQKFDISMPSEDIENIVDFNSLIKIIIKNTKI